MKIEIDTSLLEQLEMSADEFLFLESLRTGQGIEMAITRLTCDLDRLEQQGYIKLLTDLYFGSN